jgi:hypothetical protein
LVHFFAQTARNLYPPAPTHLDGRQFENLDGLDDFQPSSQDFQPLQQRREQPSLAFCASSVPFLPRFQGFTNHASQQKVLGPRAKKLLSEQG